MAKKSARETKYKDGQIFTDYIPFRRKTVDEEPIESRGEQKKNLLFDMIDSIFVDRYAYKKYTKECIKQNAFMINRIMSIKYPIEARMLDRQNISPYAMYYLWNSMLWNGRRKEMWVFTKGSKKSKEETSEDKEFPDSIIDQYCIYHNIERVQFDDAYRFFKEELTSDVKAYIEHIKSLE